MAKRAVAYIDGFNFYYGAVKGEPGLKWLDFEAMCEAMLRGCDLRAVRYYTARVTDRPDDPRQSQRQDVYLRALATRPKVEIVYGQFKERERWVARAKRGRRGRVRFVEVRVTEEKGSDVNLATDLLWDALTGVMDVALVATVILPALDDDKPEVLQAPSGEVVEIHPNVERDGPVTMDPEEPLVCMLDLDCLLHEVNVTSAPVPVG